jgi:hypothetical protein
VQRCDKLLSRYAERSLAELDLLLQLRQLTPALSQLLCFSGPNECTAVVVTAQHRPRLLATCDTFSDMVCIGV